MSKLKDSAFKFQQFYLLNDTLMRDFVILTLEIPKLFYQQEHKLDVLID